MGGLCLDEIKLNGQIIIKTDCKTNCDESMDDGIAKGFFSTHVTLAYKMIFSWSFDKL